MNAVRWCDCVHVMPVTLGTFGEPGVVPRLVFWPPTVVGECSARGTMSAASNPSRMSR
jgi:hypothetical protein